MIDKTQRLNESLDSFLTEYKEKNEGNKYRPVAVGRYGIRTRESIYSKELAKDYSKNKLIFKNTLTVGMGSTQIDIGVLSEDATYAVSPAYHTYRIHDINSDYLRYCLECRNQDMFVRYVKRGSRQGKSIDLKRWITYKIPVYPESVQAEIVKRLDSVKAILSLREQELNALDDLIKARFVEMFGDINVNDKSWNCEPLGGLCTIVRGGSPRPIEQFLGGDVPWIKIGDATDDDNIYLSSTKEHIIQEGVKKSRLVKSGSLIFANCGVSLGFARIITFDGCIHDGWLAMEDIDERLDKVFLLQALNQMTEHFRAIAPAGTQPNLNTTIMKAYKQVIPPIELQRDFIRFAKQVDKSKSHDPHLPIPPLKWYPLPKNEVPIMEEKIIAITNEMAEILNIAQLKKLQEVLVKVFSAEEPERKPTNQEYLRLFLEAKSIEGCSPRTLQYYEVTVQHLFAAVNLPVRKMTTERMREYLSDYQQRRNCSKATIDNIRRNISSFFS